MKKSLIFFLMLFLLVSCKRGSDVLATVYGSEITRIEFNDWLESRNIAPESVNKDKNSVNDYLRQMAIEKITAIKAENSGFAGDNGYKSIENILYKNLLATNYIEEKTKCLKFNENAFDLSIIRIFLNGKEKIQTNSNSDIEENKKRIMASILSELKSGSDFNDIAAKYSEDALSQRKGHLGVVPESLLENEILTALKKLNEGDFTGEPLLINRSLCLIKLHKRYVLNEKNLKKIISDKENVQKIIDYNKKKFSDELYKNLLNEKNTSLKTDKEIFNYKNKTIFSIDNENFSTSELNNILRLFYTLKFGVPSSGEFSIKEKKVTSEKIFKEWIFASEAKKIFLDNDPVFKRNWFYLKRATLAGAFKYDVLLKNLAIKENEIRKEYSENLSAKYSKIDKNNKEKRVYSAYNEVREQIKNNLSREKLILLKKKWDKEILNETGFKIEKNKYQLIELLF